MENNTARRPLKAAKPPGPGTWSRILAQVGVSPNMISFLSMVVAGLSLAAAVLAGREGSRALIVLAAVGIQLRLICNLIDGMVAVEYGKKSKTGDLWNDVSDRVADVLIILGAAALAGDRPFAAELAWANGVLAVLTAYLRVLGAASKSPHYYICPMAKPHRMALLTVAFLVEAAAPTGLAAMALLQVATCYRRLARIAADLETK
jgi:phosphatidylglycerophosphate synthase